MCWGFTPSDTEVSVLMGGWRPGTIVDAEREVRARLNADGVSFPSTPPTLYHSEVGYF